MERFDSVMLVLFVSAVLLIGTVFYKSGDVRQEMIFEITGKHVSWLTAVTYPDSFFTNGTITLK
jgi:hypothetical protein